MDRTLDKSEEKVKRPFVPTWQKQEAPDLDPMHFYMAARREWNERYGEYIARERAWKKGFFIMAAITIICAFGMAYTASQSKFIPYIVQVDKLGATVAVQKADVAAKPDKRIIRAQLASWIENVRSVYHDYGAEHRKIGYAYAMVRRTDRTFTMLNEYLTKHDPFERGKSEGVSVQISSVLPISGNTWQVQWTETVHNAKGESLYSRDFQANITIDVQAPKDEETLLKNPMGIYVTNYDWSERL